MIFLSNEDTERLFDWRSAIECILAAYDADPEPGVAPGRLIARHSGASLRCLPAISPNGRYMGTKHIAFSRNNRVTYLIALFDQDEADLAYLIDGLSLTALRTAATTGAALKMLGPAEEMRLAVLGSGLEARTHVEAFSHVRPIRSISVYSPTPANREAFARRFETQLGIAVRPAASEEEAIDGATHIIAAARSRGEKPILYGDWLVPGTFVFSIGSTVPNQREIDVSVVDRADLIIADDPKELAEQTGDMMEATARGIRFDHKIFSLQQLVRGALKERLADRSGVVLFKSLGSARQDIAVAELIADRAGEAGIGVRLPVGLTEKRSSGKR